MTRSVYAIIALAVAGSAAGDLNVVEEVLIDRAATAWARGRTGVENTTLGKAGNSMPGLACILPQPKLIQSELPQKIRDAEYAVRGEIVKLSAEIQKELDANPEMYKFSKLIPCNIGNPQAVGMKPLTFYRQVLSVILDPKLIKNNGMPSDVQERGKEFAATNPGAYSHSKGSILFRKKVCDYIDRRDGLAGIKADPEDIFLTDGATPAVKTVLELVIDNKKDVVMIPIPQYPLYSASVTRLGGTWVGYDLVEDYGLANPTWGIDIKNMEKIIRKCRSRGQRVRALAVINPGNPTGNVMSEEDIRDVISLAEKYNMIVLADEVYQDNVYAPGKKFHSFRKVALKMMSKAQIFSFHSISKGYYGECGLRGGYVQMENIDKSVNDEMYKMMSMSLCSNTVGQAMMAQIVNPPVPGDPSYKLFEAERSGVFDGMIKKAGIVHKMLNEVPGIQCMPIEGAMYAFPRVTLPKKYINQAKKLGKTPDTLYCIEVLKELGVIMVPGSGFGQIAGTYHYRLTILPELKDLEGMLKGLKAFQEKLYAQYGTPKLA
jgi:aspartate/methionine/tyrosine aminotransferase